MTDIFLKADALELLDKKHIVFLGDSNVRGIYKDIIWLLNHNTVIDIGYLKRKLESTFLRDRLIKGDKVHRGRDYVEVREFRKNNMHIEFHFLTRCYTKAIENMMNDIKNGKKSAPDVIVMNSCVWDITRWGPNGVSEYKDNLVKLMKLFRNCLPEKSIMIWATALPVSSSISGGFLVKQVEFLKHTLRFEVMEANMFARQVVVSHGFDVLDIHHHLRMQIHRRADDGIHWLPLAVRHMTNLILTHVALSWNHPLPGNFKSKTLTEVKESLKASATEDVNFPPVPKVFQEETTQATTTRTTAETLKKSENKRRKQRSVIQKAPLQVSNTVYQQNFVQGVPQPLLSIPLYFEAWGPSNNMAYSGNAVGGPVRSRRERSSRKTPYNI